MSLIKDFAYKELKYKGGNNFEKENINNIYISSNKIIFKDGIANGVDKNIIHSLNKNEVSLDFPLLKLIVPSTTTLPSSY